MSHACTTIRKTVRSVFTARTPSQRLWWFAILLGIGTILLIVAAGCGQKPAVVPTVQVGFLGNAACAECHPQEFKAHSASRHAVTMQPVNRASLGANGLKPGAIKGTSLALYKAGDGMALGWKDKEAGAVPMQFALGSGRFAFTYIHLLDTHSLMELRQTYYTQTREWLPTPGQEYTAEDTLGRAYKETISRHCLGCHTTTLPANDITPEPRFYGVGCEACHGPGQKHVAAVQAGEKTNLFMEKLGALGATKLNELCGRCHRTAKDVAPDQADMTHRFAPYGLMKSRYFLESGDKLSCATCHDSHTNPASDEKVYEKACLSRHPSQSVYGPVDPRRRACPVNPRRGCISCHMPERDVAEGIPFQMTDHFIHVFHPKEQ